MKQFHCPVLGPKLYTYDEIRDKFPGTLAALRDLGVGESAIDCDQDLWVRKADVDEETLQDDAPMTDTNVEPAPAGRDERLERIATAAMAAIINKIPLKITYPNDTDTAEMVARGAFNYAKALIAKLDEAE